jgi:hypothetical protein
LVSSQPPISRPATQELGLLDPSVDDETLMSAKLGIPPPSKTSYRNQSPTIMFSGQPTDVCRSRKGAAKNDKNTVIVKTADTELRPAIPGRLPCHLPDEQLRRVIQTESAIASSKR